MNAVLAQFLVALVGAIILYIISLIVAWLNDNVGWFFTIVILIAILWILAALGFNKANKYMDKLGVNNIIVT